MEITKLHQEAQKEVDRLMRLYEEGKLDGHGMCTLGRVLNLLGEYRQRLDAVEDENEPDHIRRICNRRGWDLPSVGQTLYVTIRGRKYEIKREPNA